MSATEKKTFQPVDKNANPLFSEDPADVFDATGHISLSAGDRRKILSLTRTKNIYRNLLFVVLSINSIFLAGKLYQIDTWFPEKVATFFSSNLPETIETITESDKPPGFYPPELLRAMGARMAELGYPNLTAEQLARLRDRGLTATFVGQMQEAGYTLSLSEASKLAQRGVTARFAIMMRELGYPGLSVAELIKLKDNDVTAFWVGNMADAGFRGLTIEQLIRLRTVGVSNQTVQRFTERNGRQPTLEEVIRFQISNQ